jgi:hypothetical protein
LRAPRSLPSESRAALARAHQSYFADLASLRFAPIDDGVLVLARPAASAASRGESAAA